MYSLYLSFAVSTFIVGVPMLFGAGNAKWSVLPGIMFGVLSFVWVNRRVAKRVEAVTQAADKEMAGLQQVAQRAQTGAAKAAMEGHFDRAVEILKRGFIFEKWQIGVTTMLNARIGMLLYMRWMLLKRGGLTEAIPYLEKSRVKGRKAKLLAALWPAWAMLAVAYYKGKKDLGRALAVLEDTVLVSKKEGLLWSLYAWILWKEKRRDDAINVLARAKDALPDDKRVAENLKALQNNKKMRMKDYGEQWYQFGLETPKMAGMKPQMSHPRARAGGMRRR